MSRTEKLVASASVVSSLAAAIALMWNVYVFQETSAKNEEVLNAAIERQNETAAVELYQEYLSLAFLYPDFAFEEIAILDLPEQEGKKYLIFAASALTISERIYELTNAENGMDTVIKSIVRNHIYFINQDCEEIGKPFLRHLRKSFPEVKCT